MTSEAKKSRMVIGEVVSAAMDKTIVVRVDRRIKHPVYGKFITRSSKFHAHDETNTCQKGDVVKIQESRPLSKTKTWVFVDVVEKSPQ